MFWVMVWYQIIRHMILLLWWLLCLFPMLGQHDHIITSFERNENVVSLRGDGKIEHKHFGALLIVATYLF